MSENDSTKKYKVLLLVSMMSGSEGIKKKTRNLKTLLQLKNITIEQEVDGGIPENKDMRTLLFKISGAGPVYPQVFKFNSANDTDIHYIGTADDIMEYNENSTIPQEVLAAHPEIPTLERKFEGCFS
eukprot:g2376.t1